MLTSIVVINGPNLNLLGRRNPQLYGRRSFEDFLDDLMAGYQDTEIQYYQSNHEGQLIDWLHDFGFREGVGIILNAGGYTHTSVALRDAIEAIPAPVVDVHLTDIYSREPFRSVNLLAEVCMASVVGEGLDGYRRAVELLLISGR